MDGDPGDQCMVMQEEGGGEGRVVVTRVAKIIEISTSLFLDLKMSTNNAQIFQFSNGHAGGKREGKGGRDPSQKGIGHRYIRKAYLQLIYWPLYQIIGKILIYFSFLET